MDIWTRAGQAERIGPAGIFGYMDGSGELYLGYRLRFLDAWQYSSPEADGILVELYQMRSSDDAFGLLSGDWGGEPVGVPAATGEPRALYGAGLLRVWADDVYARVLARQETERSRAAVLALGRAILSRPAAGAAPALVGRIPSCIGSQFRLRPSRTVFLRSHLVLNSVYFLSLENLLELGAHCEAVAATYAHEDDAAVQLLFIRYPDPPAASAALRHYLRVYLPERDPAGDEGYAAIEDGWAGYRQSGRALALVFACAGQTSARLFIESATQAMTALETAHE